jgi:formylglycine-generating enzyme required for sulfatase activity
MPTSSAPTRILTPRRLAGLFSLVAALLALAPAFAGAARPQPPALPKPAVLAFKVAQVGDPGNPSVGIVPFTDAIYGSCAEAPAEPEVANKSKLPAPCQQVGNVPYSYGIGELEVTVAQYVAFLNTVDPLGRNTHNLYAETESGAAWPRFGQIDFSASASAGHHFTAAAPEWLDKPYAFANFLRSARFANSLANGKVLARRPSSSNGFTYVTYRVRLSRRTSTGMYDMHERAMTRDRKSGFVIPSQNEWIKAAYYDPKGGGTDSYWKYPTNEGTFGAKEADAPAQSKLEPLDGDVLNAETQPLATFHAPETEAPAWCPSNQTREACETVNPVGLPPKAYAKAYQGSVGTVGQAKTFSPWGTLDQGGNVVEWTDTITPPPFGAKGHRVWRRLHGGIANAPAYQLWISAVGLQPQDNVFYTATYPWLGMRIGVIGALSKGAGN